MSAYKNLEKTFYKYSQVKDSLSILEWDSSVMMPKNSYVSRGNQLATLSGIAFDIITDKKIPDLIKVAKEETLDDWQKANLYRMERLYIHKASLDKKLIENLALAENKSKAVWVDAKKNNDFLSFSKEFKEILKLVREVASIKSEVLNCSKYEALLDQFDPGRKVEEIDQVFEGLKEFLIPFVGQVIDHQKSTRPQVKKLTGKYDVKKQKEIGKAFMKNMGFDFDAGRLDVSEHPFSGGIPEDIRITSRYDSNDFTTGLLGVFHETGHAMYEKNLPRDYLSQPVGCANGMTIHESQSLLIEMQICRDKDFLQWLQPKIVSAFGDSESFSVKNLFYNATKVERSFIRVDADEVTYPLHVILRYEIEKKLLEGELEVSDIPGVWNEYMHKFIGKAPNNDTEGCLQDIHWPMGAIGYFPTYTLGAIAAAQFYNKAFKEVNNLGSSISKGDFSSLNIWLKDNIHAHGSKYSPDDLVKKVTGEALNVDCFIGHLKNRYLS